MTPTVAAVILIVVVIVVGAGGYAALSAASSSSGTTHSSCVPASVCAPITTNNDVKLYTPYTPGLGQKVATAAVGSAVPISLTLTGGEAATSFSVNWGDGTSASTSSIGTFSHSYGSEGIYLIVPTAQVGTTTHTGTTSYFPIEATQSLTNLTFGYFPSLTTSFTNGTSGGVYPWIAAGGAVTVSASYKVFPSATGWTAGAPSLKSTGGVQSNQVLTSSSASATYTFANPGMYWVTFVGPSSNATTTLYQDFTWAVDVLATNSLAVSCSLCAAPTAKSPHPGVLDVVEVGGPPIGGIDPSYDYDTVGDEPILNVFETLVDYNGTAVGYNPGSYVPTLATCVPGSAQCTTLYGNDLIVNGAGNAPQYWTFVLDKNARMYDPNTGKAEPVYPSDVMFSVSRAVAYADLPGSGYYNGWILAQALLPGVASATNAANPLWDNGIHYPANNTPENVLGSMIVNDSRYCPSAGLSANGCITFNVWGDGHSWPNFLQLITDPLGGSVTECSYYIAIAATLPGFGSAQAATPDSSCLLPDGGTTTNSTAWSSYLAGLNPESWDTAEIAAGDAYPHATPQTETVAAGSGPYYLVTANFGIGYTMKANPDYAQPIGCTGNPACLPAPGAFAGTVNVQWMLTDEQAIADYQSGFADLAGIYTSHAATELTLQQKGLIGILQAPTTNIGFMMPNLEINIPGLKTIDPYSTNIQANTFANNGLRAFLTDSFPYATVQNTLNTVDGLSFFFTYAGYFPEYLGNIYPTNNPAVLATFPNYNTTTNTFTDPSSNAAQKYSAAWWWSQITTPGSPVYDPQFGPGGYTASNPLVFPLIGEIGATTLDATFKIWIPLIEKLTNNVIQPDTFDLSFSELGANIGAPGQTALSFWVLAWAADYASPWDFAIPMFLPDGTYSGPNAYYETLTEQKFGATTDTQGSYNDVSLCGHATGDDANLSYWAAIGEIPTACQGIAYNVSVWGMIEANQNPNLALGVTEYQDTDAVFAELGMMVPDGQSNAVLSYAPWVNPASIDTNLIYSGGLADIVWYDFGGNGVV